MKVINIQFNPVVTLTDNNLKNTKPNEIKADDLKMLPQFAYRDYNISFGERLHRTPENFYAQTFNRNNMPDSMKKYLYSDYEQNSRLAPALIMKLVFEDVDNVYSNRTENPLAQIRVIYGDREPLFRNLTDTPNKKVRKGTVADIEMLKDEFNSVPLLKDGNSELGIYLLKKIYFDGKSLDEIRKDFKKDLSPEYEGLIGTDLQYDDIYAYGISFPKTPYWKSFLATREDFPYVYRPRKITGGNGGGHGERTLSGILSGTTYTPQKPKFKVKDNAEGKRYGDAILKGHGNRQATEKSLRGKGIYDNEKVSFVTKYLSEIMSIALEKTHASEEMRSFFENYDNLSKRQQEKLDVYWNQNPIMKELQSLAISDTIKLFFEYYGADGNNPEFQELLEYARSIKPLREEQLRQHDLIQAEYDEMAKTLPVEEPETPSKPVASPQPELTKEEIDIRAKEEALKRGAQIFKVTKEDGTEINFIAHVGEEFDKSMRKYLGLVPTPALNKFIRYCLKSEYSTPEYRTCMALQSYLPAEYLEQLGLDRQRCNITATKLNTEYNRKYPHLVAAAQQAMAEMLINKTGEKNLFLLKTIASMQQRYAMEKLGISSWTPEEQILVDKKFHDYNAPVKDKNEVNRIARLIPEFVRSVDPDSSRWFLLGELDDVDALFAANLRKYPELVSEVAKTLKNTRFLENYDGSSRALLKDDVSQTIKIAKSRLLLRDFIGMYPDYAVPYLALDLENINKYVSDPQTKLTLINRHSLLSKV